MSFILSFSPLLLFIIIFVGSGAYFTVSGVPNAFYQLSPTVGIIPAIGLGWFFYRGTHEQRMQAFLDGARHRDIITMCIVFLLAGAFSTVTQSIGSVDDTVHLALSAIPSELLLVGIFLTAAFISTAIGTSMGTIATLAPIAAGLIKQGAFSPALGMATVVGGAMFGDNLSMISDTTIAAVLSQEADMKKKLRLNAQVAIISAMITIVILFLTQEKGIKILSHDYSLLRISPYFLLVLLAFLGVNVFVILILALLFAGCIGIFAGSYSLLSFNADIVKGFSSMQEIMLLSLFVGGLSGLMGNSSKRLAESLSHWIGRKKEGIDARRKVAQLVIAQIVSVFDVLFANNTVAIVFSGEIARNIAKKYCIPPHYSAAWLDIFSCVFQGLIPYGAQILLASSICGISPLEITPHVYYCFILGIVSVMTILLTRMR